MGAIDEFVAADENILWRGQPDRRLYVTWARSFLHGMTLISATLTFIGLYFFLFPSLVGSLVIVLLLGAIYVPMNEWKIRRVAFFGAYAITDKHVLRLNMRLAFASVPCDSALAYHITQWRGSHRIRFSHPGCRTIRFGCLTEADVAALEEVLKGHS